MADKRFVYITEAEVKYLVSLSNPLQALLVLLCYDCCMRLTDVLNLTRGDVTEHAIQIANIHVVCSPAVYRAFKVYESTLPDYPDPNILLFEDVSYKKAVYQITVLSRYITKPVTPKTLRLSKLALIYKTGMPIVLA